MLKLLQPRRNLRIVGIGEDAAADDDGDLVGVERAPGRQQHAVLLVLLADDHRRVGAAVELLLELRLDQRALLLHDEDRLQPVGEAVHALRLKRPRRGDLVEAEPEIGGAHLVDAEEVERAERVEPALAERDDAEPRLRPAPHHDAVEPVLADEGERRRLLPAMQQLLLLQRMPVSAAGGGC